MIKMKEWGWLIYNFIYRVLATAGGKFSRPQRKNAFVSSESWSIIFLPKKIKSKGWNLFSSCSPDERETEWHQERSMKKKASSLSLSRCHIYIYIYILFHKFIYYWTGVILCHKINKFVCKGWMGAEQNCKVIGIWKISLHSRYEYLPFHQKSCTSFDAIGII